MIKRHANYLHPYFNDRRCGQDRRKYLYTVHIPERRTGTDRRSMKDRRSFLERRKTLGKIVNKREKKTN
jgi:hypothetical protein